MANVTVLGSCVQGKPYVGTCSDLNSTIAVTITQTGTGYFLRGQVVDDSNFGSGPTITALKAAGAIV